MPINLLPNRAYKELANGFNAKGKQEKDIEMTLKIPFNHMV
jgi:hypothetical protein